MLSPAVYMKLVLNMSILQYEVMKRFRAEISGVKSKITKLKGYKTYTAAS